MRTLIAVLVFAWTASVTVPQEIMGRSPDWSWRNQLVFEYNGEIKLWFVRAALPPKTIGQGMWPRFLDGHDKIAYQSGVDKIAIYSIPQNGVVKEFSIPGLQPPFSYPNPSSLYVSRRFESGGEIDHNIWRVDVESGTLTRITDFSSGNNVPLDCPEYDHHYGQLFSCGTYDDGTVRSNGIFGVGRTSASLVFGGGKVTMMRMEQWWRGGEDFGFMLFIAEHRYRQRLITVVGVDHHNQANVIAQFPNAIDGCLSKNGRTVALVEAWDDWSQYGKIVFKQLP